MLTQTSHTVWCQKKNAHCNNIDIHRKSITIHTYTATVAHTRMVTGVATYKPENQCLQWMPHCKAPPGV